MSDTPPTDIAVNEPVLWCWMARDRAGHLRRLGGDLLTWRGMALMAVLCTAALWWLYGTDYCDANSCRRRGLWLFLSGLLLLIAAMRLLGLDTGRLERFGRHGLRPSRFEAPFARYRGFLLTPTRLLRLGYDGAIDSVRLGGGRALIRYGALQIDGPGIPDQPLITRIPEHLQRSLFAAIQKARAIREGKDTDIPEAT